MLRSQADVTSEKANRYLIQLCKHFRHKVPAEWREEGPRGTGEVDFPMGRCEMSAEAGTLTIVCQADSGAALSTVKRIVEDHLVRFGHRENLSVDWSDAP